jgi:hypothetical protein
MQEAAADARDGVLRSMAMKAVTSLGTTLRSQDRVELPLRSYRNPATSEARCAAIHGHALLRDLLQRLVQVSDQISGIFDARRQADERLADSQGRPLLGGQHAMGGHGGIE